MRFVTATFCSLTLIAGAGSVAAQDTVSVATGEYEPFVSEAAEGGGFVNAIVAQVIERAGYTSEFTYMPWKRTLELTRRGRFTASSYWYYSAEREAEFIHVGPLFEDKLVFFTTGSPDDRQWQRLDDLTGLKIGVVDGYTYTPEFWALGESGAITLETAPSDEANLRKLLAGRIDLFPVSDATGWHLLDTKFTEAERARVSELAKPLSASVGYLLVSRAADGAETIAADLNAALATLRAEEAVPEIASLAD